jgi:hypothetical protein
MAMLPGMCDWDWDAEIAEAHRVKQRAEFDKVSRDNKIFVKKKTVFLEEKYFAALCNQLKHRVSVVLSSFPYENGFFKVTSTGYLNLQKYLPLPPWENLKIVKG